MYALSMREDVWECVRTGFAATTKLLTADSACCFKVLRSRASCTGGVWLSSTVALAL